MKLQGYSVPWLSQSRGLRGICASYHRMFRGSCFFVLSFCVHRFLQAQGFGVYKVGRQFARSWLTVAEAIKIRLGMYCKGETW